MRAATECVPPLTTSPTPDILLRVGHTGLARLKSALSGQPGTPVAWRNSVAVVAGMVVAGGSGLVVDQYVGGRTFAVSLIVGMFLGLVAVAGPFFMALRLIVGIGVLLTGAVGLAVVALDHAWLAVLGIVILVFVGTVWTAIPLVGGPLGSFPTLVYVMVLAQGQTLTGGGVAGRVMLGSVVGVVGGLVVLVAFSGWDPRKATRGLVAGSWGSGATGQQQGAALQVLRLDSAPRSYVSLVRAAVIARIARNRLESDSATSTYQHGTAAQETIAATVLPRGAMVPRPVPTSVDDARHEMQAASTSAPDRAVVYAWERWQASLGYASAILTGRTVPRADTITGGTLTAEMVRSVLHPESASFRYGVQRAVALGIATFVMLSTDLPEFYWVLLTIFAVMQTNAVATQARAVQYAVGTWIGALAAVALSLVLPSVVLGVLAVALLAAGFAWMVRNYLIMCVAIAAAVALLVGSPDGQYLQWAGLRALDCTVGALTAVAVSAFILRVRPHPELHVEQARDALLTTLARLRAGLADEHVDMAPVLASQASLQRALSNLRSDIQLTRDSDWATEQLAQLTDVNDRVIALGSVVVERAGSRSAEDRRSDEVLVSKGLEDAERRVRAIPVAAASPT